MNPKPEPKRFREHRVRVIRDFAHRLAQGRIVAILIARITRSGLADGEVVKLHPKYITLITILGNQSISL